MNGVRKRFGATVALANVDLLVHPGEVHALIGENGAGKSTLMKVLSGAIRPDEGRMEIDGRPFSPRRPEEARAGGVAMIYQELTLAPHLSVEENVMLGIEQTRWGVLQRRPMRQHVRAALRELGHPEIRPDVPVRRLSVGAQQLVEVARALVSDARIVVMDEPTSSLTREDVDALFALIRRLRERGVSIIYISHFLEEVREIAGRFTVLRDGQVVGGGAVAETPTERIIELMVGRNLSEMFPRVPHRPGEPVLDLHRLSGPRAPRDVSLSLRAGEILGLFGLIGAGRSELARTVFGLLPAAGGTVAISRPGRPAILDGGVPPDRRLAQGVGMVSEDRKDEGLALPLSIADNITLSRLSTVSSAGLLSLRRQRRAAREWMRRLEIRARGPLQAVWNLSGGNQQKVAIARLLHQEANILLLDEPTRGIDVGAKIQIYRLMGELAASGRALLFVSSYLPELMGICDRIGVMSRGRLVTIRPTAEWTEQEIMAAAVGGTT
jgi:ribose transport system ATP-binding protein